LAVFKARAADLPLDPEYPADLINYILADCNLWAILHPKDLAQETAIGVADAISTSISILTLVR
jgi:non-ribosomal peptide synthetase component F